MHAQAGSGIHLDDRALPLQRAGYISADDVDSTYVQPDHPGGGFDGGSEFRMNVVGDICRGPAGGKVGVVAEDNTNTFAGNGFGVQSLGRKMRECGLIKMDFC